jgi:hypothetical protein
MGMKTAVTATAFFIIGAFVGLLAFLLLSGKSMALIPFLLVMGLVGVSYQVLYWLRRSE